MRLKHLLVVVALSFLGIISIVFAIPSQTGYKVLDVENPSFEFTENAFSNGETIIDLTYSIPGEQTLYLKIPKESTIKTAELTLSGSLYTESGSCSNSVSCTSPDPVAPNTYSCSYYVHGHVEAGSSDDYETWTVSVAGGDSSCSMDSVCSTEWTEMNCYGDTKTCSEGQTITTITGIECENYLNDPSCYAPLNDECSETPNVNNTLNMEWDWDSYPHDITIDVNDDGVADWTYNGEFSSSESVNLDTTKMNTWLNSCTADENGLCELPLSFGSSSEGMMQISNLNIVYDYEPSNVFSESIGWSYLTDIIAGNVYYLANIVSFDSNPSLSININYIKINSGATQCWQDGSEKTVTTIEGNTVCDVIDFTVPDTGQLPSSTRIWNNLSSNGVPVTKSEGSYEQDTAKITTVNGNAYIKSQITLTNVLDTGETLSGTWYVDPRVGWICDTCSGTFTNLAEDASVIYNTEQHLSNVITSVEGGNNDWVQDESQTTEAGGTAYVKGNIKAINSDTVLGYTSVLFPADILNQYRDGWTCVQSSETFDINAQDTWASSNYPTRCNKNNIITKSDEIREQDTSKNSNITTQYAKKEYVFENTDTITYNSILWTGNADWGSCDICSGTITSLAPSGVTSDYAYWHGDVLTESWSNWEQETGQTSTLTNQYIKRVLTVDNDDSVISFVDIGWNIAPLMGFVCITCSGTFNIAANSGIQQKAVAGGDVLEEEWTWLQDETKETESNGSAYIKRILNVSNPSAVDFKDVLISATQRSGWTCNSLEDYVDVSASSSIEETVMKCYASGIVKIENLTVSYSTTTPANGEQYTVYKYFTLHNTDDEVTFNTNTKIDIRGAVEGTVKIIYVDSGDEEEPDEITTDYVKWNNTLEPGQKIDMRVQYDKIYTTSPSSELDEISGGGGGGWGGSVEIPLPQCIMKFGNMIAGQTMIQICNNPETYVAQIKLTVKNNITNGLIKVIRYYNKPSSLDEPESGAFVYLLIEPINFKNEDIVEAEISFIVDRAWLEENGLDEDRGILYRNTEDEWEEYEGTKTKSTSDRVIYKVKVKGFSYFAIGAAEKEEVIKEDVVEESETKTLEAEESETLATAEESQADEVSDEVQGHSALIIVTKKSKIIGALIGLSLLAFITVGLRTGRIRTLSIKFTLPTFKIPKFKFKKKSVYLPLQEKTTIELTPLIRAALTVMHPKEREIVQNLLKTGGESTMAKIYAKTLIPTTSLQRWVDSLERKEIIQTWKVGKLRYIKLTKKFLGVEKI